MEEIKTEEKEKNLNGKEKAAILLISLGKEKAARVLQELDEKEAKMIAEEISRWENVPAEIAKKVWEEFYQISLASTYSIKGGENYAREILNRALGNNRTFERMKKFEEDLQQKDAGESFMEFLERVDAQTLLNFIKSEHPQTVALILSYLNPQKASLILSSLPPDLQTEIAMRIINISEVSPEVLREIDNTLRKEFSSLSSQEKLQSKGGARTVAEILNLMEKSAQEHILEGLEKKDTELAREVKEMMFVFEDILSVDDRSIQRCLREIDTKDLAMALKGAKNELREKFFKNMSSRAAQTMREEIELMGPVRMREVEEAQRKIADIFRRLGEKGEVIIGSEKEEMVV